MRARRSSTAMRTDKRPLSSPCAERRGWASLVSTTNALKLDQQRPAALHRRHHDRAGVFGSAVAQEQPARVGHADQAEFAHLEQAQLARGAEAVLERAQQAERVVALTLEGQHGVDEVLERARTRQRAVLGDMADQHDGQAALLGELDERLRARLYLGHRAGRRPERGVGDGLDRVDDQHFGDDLARGGQDPRQFGLRREPQRRRRGAQAFGAQPHLIGRFLGRYQ